MSNYKTEFNELKTARLIKNDDFRIEGFERNWKCHLTCTFNNEKIYLLGSGNNKSEAKEDACHKFIEKYYKKKPSPVSVFEYYTPKQNTDTKDLFGKTFKDNPEHVNGYPFDLRYNHRQNGLMIPPKNDNITREQLPIPSFRTISCHRLDEQPTAYGNPFDYKEQKHDSFKEIIHKRRSYSDLSSFRLDIMGLVGSLILCSNKSFNSNLKQGLYLIDKEPHLCINPKDYKLIQRCSSSFSFSFWIALGKSLTSIGKYEYLVVILPDKIDLQKLIEYLRSIM